MVIFTHVRLNSNITFVQFKFAGGSTPLQSSLHSTLSSSVRRKCDTPKHSRKLNASNDSDDHSSITDNLLKLPKNKNDQSPISEYMNTKRAKASDFFK